MGIGAIATKKHAARTFYLFDVCFIEGKSAQVEKSTRSLRLWVAPPAEGGK